MADSTIQELAALETPAGGDLVPCADVSDANVVKKLTLSKVMEFVNGNNGAFSVSEDGLTLLKNLDCGNKVVSKVAAGSEDGDAVNFGQIKAAIQSLAGVNLATPVVVDKGAFLRVSVGTVLAPWGGFYLFYWCVDDSPSTQITLVNGSPVASSGASVNFDGSVANIVNVIKDGGWTGKHFHVVVRYRNLVSISGISGTGHLHVETGGFPDLVGTGAPAAITTLSVEIKDNVVYVNGDEEAAVAGQMYRCELLLDDDASTRITGLEENLVSVMGLEPKFAYDIPMMSEGKSYVHARIVTVSMMRVESYSDTATKAYDASEFGLTNAMMDFIADRMKEKLKTKDGEGLERN